MIFFAITSIQNSELRQNIKTVNHHMSHTTRMELENKKGNTVSDCISIYKKSESDFTILNYTDGDKAFTQVACAGGTNATSSVNDK